MQPGLRPPAPAEPTFMLSSSRSCDADADHIKARGSMHKTEIARGFQEVLLVEGREHYRIFHLTSQQTRKAGRAGAISHILEQGAGDGK